MSDLLARYVDGSLTEAEAAQFLAALETDPALEARLRAHEQLVVLASQLPRPRTSPGFTREVMGRIQARGGVARRPRGAKRGIRFAQRALVVAASIVLLFGAGWWAARNQSPPAGSPELVRSSMPHFEVMPASWISDESAGSEFVAVRLVYAPTRSAVNSVSVAGSFNGWNPQDVPLRPDGPLWSAVLVLPRDTYDYMFIENGDTWVPDPHAPVTRDDGFGGRNAVLDLRI